MPGLCKRNAAGKLGRVAVHVADGLGIGGGLHFGGACTRGYVARVVVGEVL